ncbi:hypothetical protein J3A83DRAFT_4231785 [Scleroderma citrinum]
MSESIFGRPSHLLPSQSRSNSPVQVILQANDSTRVAQVPSPPNIHNLRFQTIGKQPALLSRISQLGPTAADYRSPSPSPLSPTSVATSSIPTQSSRPSLFQQLTSVAGTSTAHASSTSNVSYASSVSSDPPFVASAPSNIMSGSPKCIPPPRPHINRTKNTVEFRVAPAHGALIPPIETLPQDSNDSRSATFNQSHAKSLEVIPPSLPLPASSSSDARILIVSHPPPTATKIRPARQPTDEASAPDSHHTTPDSRPSDSRILSRLPTASEPTPLYDHLVVSPLPSVEESQSSPNSDCGVRELSRQPSTLTDAIAECEARLVAAKTDLSMAIFLKDATCISSPSPGPSAVELRDLPFGKENRPREEPNTIQPSPHFQLPKKTPSGDVNHPMGTEGNVPTPASPPATLSSQFQTHTGLFFEAVQGLTSAFDAVQRSHTEVENNLARQQKILDEHRCAFQQEKCAVEADHQAQLQELNHVRESLRQREAALAASEKEFQSREEARRILNAQRRAQEEKRRADAEAHVRKLEEQVAMGLKELDELKTARKAEQHSHPADHLPPVPVYQNLPTEVQESMDEEEVKIIGFRKALHDTIERIRRAYKEKVDLLEQSASDWSRLQEELKKRAAEEARQKLLDEEERAHQAAIEEQRKLAAAQAEQEKSIAEAAERRSSSGPNGIRKAPQCITEKPAYAEVRAPQKLAALSNTHSDLEQQRQEYARKRAEVMAQKQQANAENAARIRAAREGLPVAPMEGNDTAAVESCDASEMSPPAQPAEISRHSHSSPKSGTMTVVSGDVMLSVPQGSNSLGPTTKSPISFPFGDGKGSVVTGKAPSFVSASTEAGRQVVTDTPLFPIQLASELNSASSANADSYRTITPPPRQAFTLNPKSQTILEAGAWESNLRPRLSVSPARRTVNLRHLKKSRSHAEDGGGNRSVIKGSVKVEDSTTASFKQEESQDLPIIALQSDSTSCSDQHETSTSHIPPPRVAVISPPRPRLSSKQALVPAPSVTDAHSNSVVSSRVTEVLKNTQALLPPSQPARASPSPWVMDASAEHPEWAPQLTPPSPSSSKAVHLNHQESSSQVKGQTNIGSTGAVGVEEPKKQPLVTERGHQRQPLESPAASSHETDSENRSRSWQQSQYQAKERVRTYTREVDHYSPSKSSRLWRRRSSERVGDDHRKRRISGTPPSPPPGGRKRRSESVDDDYASRSRRVRRDSYLPDAREPEFLPRQSSYRPPSPPEYHRYRPRYPSSDYRSGASDLAPAATSHASVREPLPLRYVPQRDTIPRVVDDVNQPHRYQRPPPDSAFAREQEIQQNTEDQVEDQHDPLLLARMSDTQHFPV